MYVKEGLRAQIKFIFRVMLYPFLSKVKKARRNLPCDLSEINHKNIVLCSILVLKEKGHFTPKLQIFVNQFW